jgi:hypothetical protein
MYMSSTMSPLSPPKVLRQEVAVMARQVAQHFLGERDLAGHWAAGR